MRILIVEDKDDDAELLVCELESNGYDLVYQQVDASAAILTLEDNLTDAKQLVKILTTNSKQWLLIHAKRLHVALKYLAKSCFDVVLLDLSLPDSHGLDTVTKVQAAVPNIPIVVLTGNEDEELALQAVAMGAQDYLIKGKISAFELSRAIRYAIERKLAEAQMRKALEQERELNYLKSNFVSMVSHEFRNPLSTIRSSADLLQRYSHKLTEEKKSKYFEQIFGAISNMLQLLDEVLLLGKDGAGRLEYLPLPMDLKNFCLMLVETLQLDVDNDREIVFTCYGEPIVVEMDEFLLRHILSNLLSNAVKYSPANSKVRFDLIYEDGKATFQIQDWGIGIPAKDRQLLFDTFHRFSNVGEIQGTGLGLSIVKKCVDLHKGQIEVESELDAGTTFTVTLPFNQPTLTTTSVFHHHN